MEKIIFVAGGSGGHITPAIALADYIKEKHPYLDIIFICSKSKLDQEIIKNAGFDYKPISSGKLRRYFDWQNFTDFFKFFKAIFQSFFILKKEKPDLVFSKGGFVALPVGFASRLLKIPLIIHESDVKAGLANRLLAKWACKVLTGFKLKNNDSKYKYTSTPIRQTILKADKKRAEKFLDFKDNKKPLIFVIGGSQGAEVLNQAIKNIHKELDYNFVLISGKGKKPMEKADNLKVFEYLNIEFADILKASDLVISRAGANSIAEIAALKKASILVPLKNSANDHQFANAQKFGQKKAAIMIEEEELSPDRLKKEIIKIISNPDLKNQMAKNLESFYNKDAVSLIAEEIFSIEKRKNN